ncbi:MAG: hypothetical protein IPK60_16525 [Sandaracinaceae bacterium]|nr:hypothetical protein [Sandaracinaceae bacterium]
MLARLGTCASFICAIAVLAGCSEPPDVQVGVYTVTRATRNDANCYGEGPSRDPMPRFIRVTHRTDNEFAFGECDEATCLQAPETWVAEERFLGEHSGVQSWVAERATCTAEGSFNHVTQVRTTLIPRDDTVRVTRSVQDGVTRASCEEVTQQQMTFACIRLDAWEATIR